MYAEIAGCSSSARATERRIPGLGLLPPGLLPTLGDLLHLDSIDDAGRRALNETSAKIRVAKATADDLVEISDFIKPFVDSGDLLPRTFDEL